MIWKQNHGWNEIIWFYQLSDNAIWPRKEIHKLTFEALALSQSESIRSDEGLTLTGHIIKPVYHLVLIIYTGVLEGVGGVGGRRGSGCFLSRSREI